MADKREHIERDGMLIEFLQILTNGKLRTAVLSNCDRRDPLRYLCCCRRILVQSTIGMVVCVDETRRQDEAVRVDHLRFFLSFDSAALPYSNYRGTSDDYNCVFD